MARLAILFVTLVSLSFIGDGGVEIVMRHVNDDGFPRLNRPPSRAGTWKEMHSQGDVAEAILNAAQQEMDLIVMTTELDFIQSCGVTERVGQALEERARDLYEIIVFLGQ